MRNMNRINYVLQYRTKARNDITTLASLAPFMGNFNWGPISHKDILSTVRQAILYADSSCCKVEPLLWLYTEC